MNNTAHWWHVTLLINSLAPGRCGSNFIKSIISEHMLWIKVRGTSCKMALRWMSQNTVDDKSTLVQVMAWAGVDPYLYYYIAFQGHNTFFFLTPTYQGAIWLLHKSSYCKFSQGQVAQDLCLELSKSVWITLFAWQSWNFSKEFI